MFQIKIREKNIPLTENLYVIGRSADADITVEYSKLSRLHTRLTIEDGRLYVEDLGSKNGVFINGEKSVQKQELQSTDSLKIADLECPVMFPEATTAGKVNKTAEKKAAKPAAHKRKNGSGIDRKEKNILIQSAVAVIVVILLMAGYSFYKTGIPEDQKKAREIIGSIEVYLQNLDITDESAGLSETVENLNKKKGLLGLISPDYRDEFGKAAKLRKQIDKQADLATRILDKKKHETALLERFTKLENAYQNKTAERSELLKQFRVFVSTSTGNPVRTRALSYIGRIELEFKNEEISGVRETIQKANNASDAGNYSDALFLISAAKEKTYEYLDKNDLGILGKTAAEITENAEQKFGEVSKRLLARAGSEDINLIADEMKEKWNDFNIGRIPALYKEFQIRLRIKRNERLAEARNKLESGLAQIEILSQQKRYSEILPLCDKLLSITHEKELKDELTRKKRKMLLLVSVQNGVIKLINRKGGISLKEGEVFTAADEKRFTLSIDGASLALSWDKIREDEYSDLVGKAVQVFNKPELYLGLGLLRIENLMIDSADEMFARAFARAPKLKTEYPELFSAYTTRSKERAIAQRKEAERLAALKAERARILAEQKARSDMLGLKAIPVWKTDFEKGSGDWSYAGDVTAYVSSEGEDEGKTEAWTINSDKPFSGKYSYKGWINKPKGKSHRAYPCHHIKVEGPICNSWYVWLDCDYSKMKTPEWIHFATWCNSVWGPGLHTMSVRNRELEMAHCDWKWVGPASMRVFPLRQWVRFTYYYNFKPKGDGTIWIWMNGVLVFEANKGHAHEFFERVHWGMYASGSLDHGVQYNDDIQLWQLSGPWPDKTKEPPSPYGAYPDPDSPPAQNKRRAFNRALENTILLGTDSGPAPGRKQDPLPNEISSALIPASVTVPLTRNRKKQA